MHLSLHNNMISSHAWHIPSGYIDAECYLEFKLLAKSTNCIFSISPTSLQMDPIVYAIADVTHQ